MVKEIDYKKLYQLQDKVLKINATLENDFYLTGGTALHRFYYNARYSGDLDFFVTNGQNFNEDVEELIEELKKTYQVVRNVSSRDFYRVTVDSLLQVDLVNDRVYRYKKSNIINGFKIDNKINILTNKKAIVEKDILIYRLKTFPVKWIDKIKKIRDIDIIKEKIDILCDDILNEKENSLYKYNG